MAVKKKTRMRGVLADALHSLILESHPHGLPLGTAATTLYSSDTRTHRERIYSLAGALRKNNIMVYSFGGRYHFCNDDGIRLTEVAVQKQILAGSILQNAFLLREKAIEAGLPDEHRQRLDKAFVELKRVVAGLF